MAQFTLNTPTPVAVGNAIPYTDNPVPGGCSIRHRKGSGNVKVKGGIPCRPVKYIVNFHGTVTGVTGFVELGIFLDGELLPETVMYVVEPTPTNVLSVDSSTEILADCACQTISVRNIAGTGLTVNTASLIVERG